MRGSSAWHAKPSSDLFSGATMKFLFVLAAMFAATASAQNAAPNPPAALAQPSDSAAVKSLGTPTLGPQPPPPHPFDVRDLVMMDRVSDPQISPDGKKVAYQLR